MRHGLRGGLTLRELGVRAALGASRWRILRQQLVESLLLAALAAIAGLVLAHWAIRAFAARTSLPQYLDLAPDARTFHWSAGDGLLRSADSRRLMVRGLQQLLVADLGFEFQQVAVLDAAPRAHGMRGAAARAYWNEVKQTLGARGDVELAALTTQVPLGDSGSTSLYRQSSA